MMGKWGFTCHSLSYIHFQRHLHSYYTSHKEHGVQELLICMVQSGVNLSNLRSSENIKVRHSSKVPILPKRQRLRLRAIYLILW